MSLRAKRPRVRLSAFNQPGQSAHSQSAASHCLGAQVALDDCIAATSLIEVTLRSLDAQTVATPEQEVLKKALQAMWSVYGWIDNLRLDSLGSGICVKGWSAQGRRSIGI